MKLRILLVLALLVAPGVASAEIKLPPGFSAQVYVTGQGFEGTPSPAARGIPSSSTLAFDRTGVLYLARTGRRYMGGEVEDIWPIYRIPLGGARLTPDTEKRYFHGPPLPNPQVAAIRGGHEVFVTTFDRDRKVGVLYRIVDREVELFAGGTPPRGAKPLLTQPEGAAVDTAGNVYVADRQQGAVVKLDAAGRVVEPRYVTVTRPRVLAMDETDHLWIGADGPAEAPWQQGPGEIWRVSPRGIASLVLRGPMPAGISVGPGGNLFVADRHAAKIIVLAPDGTTTAFAVFTDNDAPRNLGFAPVTPETRRAGIAGELFVVRINRGAWPINEVLRVSGPFEELARPATTR